MTKLVTNRSKLAQLTKEQLIDYVIFNSMSKKFREIMLTVEDGQYNTRYKLNKIYGKNMKGTISKFIKYGIDGGFLKQEWHFDQTGKRSYATLSLTRPSTVLQEEQSRPGT